jgi:hypothetical protein
MSATDPLTELYNYRQLSDEIVTAGQPTVEAVWYPNPIWQNFMAQMLQNDNPS